jgi:hypothetical protein
VSIAQIEALYAEAIAALEAGDYRAAIRKAIACKARLATTPDIDRSLAGGGQQSLKWANAVALDSFIAETRKLMAQSIAESVGLQQSKIRYRRACES